MYWLSPQAGVAMRETLIRSANAPLGDDSQNNNELITRIVSSGMSLIQDIKAKNSYLQAGCAIRTDELGFHERSAHARHVLHQFELAPYLCLGSLIELGQIVEKRSGA